MRIAIAVAALLLVIAVSRAQFVPPFVNFAASGGGCSNSLVFTSACNSQYVGALQ